MLLGTELLEVDRHSGQADDSWRDPEYENFKYLWIPGLPVCGWKCLMNFGYTALADFHFEGHWAFFSFSGLKLYRVAFVEIL
jgi:hypothetical protein